MLRDLLGGTIFQNLRTRAQAVQELLQFEIFKKCVNYRPVIYRLEILNANNSCLESQKQLKFGMKVHITNIFQNQYFFYYKYFS